MIQEVEESIYEQYIENIRLKRETVKDLVRQANKDVLINGKNSKYFLVYQDNGNRVKDYYGLDCKEFRVPHSPEFDRLKEIDTEKVKDYVLKTAKINYKKEQKWEDLRDLTVMTYTLLKNKKSLDSDPVCTFTPQSYKLFKKFSGKEIGQRTFVRLIDTADKAGFICSNKFIDDSGKLRKNYRHDMVCPENSYSTSYLVNIDVIKNVFSDFIKNRDKKSAREFYYEAVHHNRQNEEFDFLSPTLEESFGKLFNGLYDISSQTFLKVYTKTKYIESPKTQEEIKFNCDHFFKVIDIEKTQNLKVIVLHLLKYLKSEGITKVKDVVNSEKYQKVVSILSEATEDETSINTVELKMTRELFGYKSHGAYQILNGLLEEYNSDKNFETEKIMNIDILKKKALSTRIWSKYCGTSKKDGSREEFKKNYNVKFDQDVTAMVPNLLRFLKNGDKFTTEDAYTQVSDTLKTYGYTVTRDEVKGAFLRMEFSKSEKVFLKSIRDSLAFKYMNDTTNMSYYPYIGQYCSEKHKRQYLKRTWLLTAEGQKQMALYSKLYSVIEEKYGSKQDPFIFFWESLLETIITVSLKRQGITCYNIYDNFMADKEFDLENELKAAGSIVYQAYNGNIGPLKEFYNGRLH